MHKNRTISMFLAAFFLVGTGITAFSYTQGQNDNHVSKSPALLVPHRINDGIFNTSDELGNDVMTCYLTTATKTKSSITVTAQFSIGSYTEWGDRNGSVYLVIEDDDYSGDKSDPSLSGSTNPTFSGYTSQLVATSTKFVGTFVIPEKMTYGTRFSIQNTKIKAGAIDFEGQVTQVTNIVIPSTVTTIEAGAFSHVPDTVTISCVAASKPDGWAEGWTDATNVSFGYNDASVLTTKNLVLATSTNLIEHTIEDSYILGYVNKPGSDFYSENFVKDDEPLVVSYDVVTGQNKETIRKEVPLLSVDSRNAPYDAVGDIGSASISFTIDVFLEEGQELDYNSFAFYNIYVAKRDDTLSTYCCNKEDRPTYFKQSVKRFSNIIELSDVLVCNFKSISTFAGYTLITMNVDKAVPYYYETAAQNIINENAEKIQSGAYRIRYAFYNLGSSAFRITYTFDGQDFTKVVNVKTPLPVIELSKDSGNTISFILKNTDVDKNFTASSMKQFEILDLTVDMHLWNTDNNSKVGRTSRSIRFGIVDIMPYTEAPAKALNLNLVLIIVYLIYIVVYAAAATALFFFLKNKYKNDEFRRIKPNKYLKTAIIGFAGFAEILLAVVGLIYRTTVFRNSLAAFNPSDVLVVLAGIIALIIIGYFIKYVVGLVKADKARREIIRLKLNENKE